MQCKLACAIAAIGLTSTMAAQANSPKLKGDYGITGAAGCLISAPPVTGPGGGFNPLLQPNPGSRVFHHQFAIEGIRHFNGDGTGSVKASSVGFVPPPTPGAPGPFNLPGTFPPSADAHTFSFDFTYTVNGDGSFDTQLVPGSFQGTFTAGPRTGQTFTIDRISLTGLISNEAKTLTLASVTPEIETVTFSNGDIHQEICHRSRVLIWMNN
jgi:hypothetical protein